MSLLDDLAAVVVQLGDTLDIDPTEIATALESAEDQTEVLAVILNTVDPAGDVADVFVDLLEEFILTPLEEEGQLTPDTVEDALDEIEGNSVAVLSGFLALTLFTETVTAGQLDELPAEVFQAAAAFGFENVTGREVDARLQEGVDPALKQKVHRETRSKQADFKDFTEANLRVKGVEGEIEPLSGEIPQPVRDLFAPADLNHLPDPDTYGTIPDQTPLYDLVSLAHLEPEEILEEAPQKGVVPSAAAMDQAMLLSGLPEDVKQVFRDSRENVPRTQSVIEESLLVGEALFVLDNKVVDGGLTPEEATNLIEPSIRASVEVSDSEGEAISPDLTDEQAQDQVIGNIRSRFRLLASIPNDPPTESDVDRFYRQGIISAERYQTLNDRFGLDPEFFDLKLISNTIRAGAEDIRRQNRLGRLSDSQARLRLGLIGFTADQTARILSGADPDDVLSESAAQPGSPGGAGVAILPGIGDQRSALLSQVGLGTVSDVAEASVGDLTAVTGLGDEQAARAISVAQRIVTGEPPAQ